MLVGMETLDLEGVHNSRSLFNGGGLSEGFEDVSSQCGVELVFLTCSKEW